MLTKPDMADTEASFTTREFRDALGSFATGVTIITARDDAGEPVGMTASSFNSVSTEPPLILWSVTKTALSAPVFHAARHFAVHVLATDQTDLSNRFARSGEDKFGGCDYTLDANNIPIIANVAARFDCTTWAVHEGGDHWIIIGHVTGIETQHKEGLVFGGGSYATAAPLTTLSQDLSASSAASAKGEAALVDDMLFYHLSRAYHQMSLSFHQAVRDSGLTVAEWRIAASLFGKAHLSMADLSARTFIDQDTLSDILQHLEEDGMCRVERDAHSTKVHGTTKGHDRVAHLFDLARTQEAETLSPLPDDERKLLKKALRTLVEKTDPAALKQ